MKEKRGRVIVYLPLTIKEEIEGIALRNKKTVGRITGALIRDGLKTYKGRQEVKAPTRKSSKQRNQEPKDE
jgi:hypothetical protein